MSQDLDLPALQARVRKVFGPGSGDFLDFGPAYGQVAVARTDGCVAPPVACEAGSPPSLDHCTHTTLPVPDCTGENRPDGCVYTELSITQLNDGSGSFFIAERNSGYKLAKRNDFDRSSLRGVARGDVMSAEDLHRASCRAMRKFRDACSQLLVDRILTTTFRDNVVDYDKALAVWSSFASLYKAMLPYDFKIGRQRYQVDVFDYVCAPEKQKRGAWHFHAGLHGPHDVVRMRLCWHKAQRLAGLSSCDGNLDIAYRPKRGCSRRIGRYISKYISKGFQEGHIFRKRYFASRGIPAPEVSRMYFLSAHSTEDLLRFVEVLLGCDVCSSHWGKAGPYDVYYGSFEVT